MWLNHVAESPLILLYIQTIFRHKNFENVKKKLSWGGGGPENRGVLYIFTVRLILALLKLHICLNVNNTMLCTRFAFVFLAVLALCVPLIECRYLPTRRDNTKVDEIKNILTESLVRANFWTKFPATNPKETFPTKKDLFQVTPDQSSEKDTSKITPQPHSNKKIIDKDKHSYAVKLVNDRLIGNLINKDDKKEN
ncbi:Origin recognition complex subunit 2 [Armadillidium vulgare]|nr:Origin recognition complex subunit 2 [Armadillidium vulgare]